MKIPMLFLAVSLIVGNASASLADQDASGKAVVKTGQDCRVFELVFASSQIPGKFNLAYKCKSKKLGGIFTGIKKVLAAPVCLAGDLAEWNGEEGCMPRGSGKRKTTLELRAQFKDDQKFGINAPVTNFTFIWECEDVAQALNQVQGSLKIIARCEGSKLATYFEAN